MMRVLTTKFAICAAAAVMLAAPSISAAQSSSLSGLYACEAISDSSAQLACFRNETAKLRAADVSASAASIERKSLSSAPVLRAPEVSQPAVTPPSEVKQAEINGSKALASEEEDFGLVKESKVKRRTLTILSSEPYGPKGYTRFILENGEVWEQTQPGRFSLGRGDPDVLTIKRAAFGSFRGRVNDKGNAVRMQRAK